MRISNRLRNPLLALASLGAFGLLLETAARVWVAYQWTEADIAKMQEPHFTKAGFIEDSVIGYRLEPDFWREDGAERRFTHNSLGLRGSEIAIPKPEDVLRVAILGGSTVYGIYVSDDETSASVLQSLLEDRIPGYTVEVINGGVPGWTSREWLIQLDGIVMRLEPDVVMIIEGRNEAFPELFDDFVPDYSHYRRLDWRMSRGNRTWKRIFRFSHLAMVLVPNRGGILGYGRIEENPVYGYIRFDNRPGDLAQLRANTEGSGRFDGWRQNLARAIERVQSGGAVPVLVEMPFRPDGYGSGNLPTDVFGSELRDQVVGIVTETVHRNVEIARELAARYGIPFVETDTVLSDVYLIDDCHFNAEGERLLAEVLKPVVETILTERARM